MNIIFDGPELLIETDGQGKFKKGEPRDMHPDYAYSMIVSGRIRPADEAAQAEYAAMRKQKLHQAKAIDQKTAYCDACHQEAPIDELIAGACSKCPPKKVEAE